MIFHYADRLSGKQFGCCNVDIIGNCIIISDGQGPSTTNFIGSILKQFGNRFNMNINDFRILEVDYNKDRDMITYLEILNPLSGPSWRAIDPDELEGLINPIRLNYMNYPYRPNKER